MKFSGKALYNLLRSNWKKDPSLPVKPWQVEDYRALSSEQLFERLKKFDISLNKESFSLYAENCETPEDLLEYLWLKGEDIESQDQAYLLLFELWRRFFPEKRSLSLFCDELDNSIEHYLESPSQADEEIQEILHEMEDILDENVDLGADAKVIFGSIEESCAHNIESFLYDYIANQIDENNDLYASEILDGFYQYITDIKWFDFLRARLFAVTSPEESNLILGGLLEQLEEEPDLDFLFEIASYLAKAGDHELFAQAMKQGIEAAETEEDIHDFLEVMREYYRCLDRDDKVQEITQFSKRPSFKSSEDKKALLAFLT